MAPNIPETCKAIVIEKANAPYAVKEVPVKKPESNEVLIKVEACGVCHSDSFLQKGMFGPMYDLFKPCELQKPDTGTGHHFPEFPATRSLAKSSLLAAR
jgi:threonine dehydrogenase-like Zn-dependent dehydrogenase